MHENEVFGMHASEVRGYAKKYYFSCVSKNLQGFLCKFDKREQKNLFAGQNMIYIIAGIGIVIAILIILLLKRRKTNYI